MLTTATLGLMGYGLYSVGMGVSDLVGASRLELWANLWLIALGLMLLPAAAFVRAGLPGGLALALAGVLGLQSLALHNAAHLYGQVAALPQVARAAFAATLIVLAYVGSHVSPNHEGHEDHEE
jgi:hypothetical protein